MHVPHLRCKVEVVLHNKQCISTYTCVSYSFNSKGYFYNYPLILHTCLQVEVKLSDFEVTDNSEETMMQVQYLLMKYGVSKEFYHELSMIFPRSYKVAT